jgi:serine/threonine protein kinase
MNLVRKVIREKEYRSLPLLGNGRYEVDYLLAAGGQGLAIVAKDLRLGQNRVLIKAPLYGDTFSLGRYNFGLEKQRRKTAILTKEIPIVVELNWRTQNVPRMIDCFEDENAELYGTYPIMGEIETWEIKPGDELAKDVFIVYEFLSAGPKARAKTLEDLILEKGQLDESTTLNMALQIANAVWVLHEWQQIDEADTGHNQDFWDDSDHGENEPSADLHSFYIYQDLKPANILVSGDKYFFLIDFGSISVCQVRKDGMRTTYSIVNPSQAFTLGYAPLELVNQEENLSQSTDIFCLGATIFHALTGIHPVELLRDPMDFKSAPDFSPSHLRKTVPHFSPTPLVRAIIQNSTQPSPKKRYPSIRQMIEDIEYALRQG